MMSSTFATEEVVATTGEARARVSWSAIFAGVVLVIAVQVLLSVLGAGIGLGMVNPGQTTASAQGVGMAAGIWWLASTVISLLLGSYAAARLAGVPSRFDGALHGLVIWGLALLLTVYLVTSAVGGLVGGAFSVLGSTVSGASALVGSTASAAAGGAKAVLPQVQQATGLSADTLQRQAEDFLQSPTPQDPGSMSHADAVKAVARAVPDLVAGGDKAASAKQRIIDIVAAQAKISPQEAQARVDQAQARLVQMKTEATQSAEHAAQVGAAAASQGSFLAFAGLLIGAIAGAVGGAIASPRGTFQRAARFR